MINCCRCQKPIGSFAEPMFVMPQDAAEYPDDVACRACYVEVVGREPAEDEAEYDPDDLVPEEAAKILAREVELLQRLNLVAGPMLRAIRQHSMDDFNRLVRLFEQGEVVIGGDSATFAISPAPGHLERRGWVLDANPWIEKEMAEGRYMTEAVVTDHYVDEDGVTRERPLRVKLDD